MKKCSLFVSALLLSACTSVPQSVDLPPPPKPKFPPAAMKPIHPAGWFHQKLNGILSR